MNTIADPYAYWQFLLFIALIICAISIFALQTYLSLRQVARDKKTVETKLSASEMRYRIFFESAPYAGVVWTEGFIITDWNQQAERVFGWSKAEVLGRSFFDFIVPEAETEILHAALAELSENSMPAHMIHTNLTQDGRILSIEWFNTWLSHTHDQSWEVMSLGLDITKRKKTDAALISALANLEIAEAEQRHLLSVASHEFRTPAAMIKASLDSLHFLRNSIPPEVALRLDHIRQASLRLINLANQLISEDRLQEMSLQPQMQRIDVCELTREVVDRYALGDALALQLPEHSVMLGADPTLLAIALHNLIDNAIQYHPKQPQPVVVSLKENTDTVELQVADLGPGVPEEEQEIVFQRFHSAKGGASHGLGLSIVYSVAHAHGGIAFVYDNNPHGAVFVIQLPVLSS